MSGIEDRIAAVLKAHEWWLAGNLGVPGMVDATTYKCLCGWSGDEPRTHVAEAIAAELQLTHEWAAQGPGVWLSREGAAKYAKYYGRRLRARLVTPWVEEQP